jgi:hypothetical protein
MDRYGLDELKQIYRVLHAHLTEHPELMDSELLHDVQRHLQKHAQAEGVDVGDHGAWDAWLGNAPVSCESRVARRSVLS